MKVDVKLGGAMPSLAGITAAAARAEAQGYDGIWSTESAHDPFLPLVAVAQATCRARVGTAVAVAFARSPMTMAYTAHDLAVLSEGRFLLGVGSQVKGHVERRFGMPWGQPAARMEDYIRALRAIWSCWNEGSELNHSGPFYRHQLMTPFFSPPASPWGPPPVYLAAVGEKMTEVAGAVCDGLMPHPFTTERYLRERTLPALQRGLDRSGRDLENFSISFSGLVVSGRDDAEMAAAGSAARNQIAFYASTPAYAAVLELQGWQDLGAEIAARTRAGGADRWSEIGQLIDDDVLRAFAIVAPPERVASEVLARFGDLIDRFNFYTPYDHHPDLFGPAVAQLRQSATRPPAATMTLTNDSAIRTNDSATLTDDKVKL